jgi:hypothetical protein
VQLSTTQRPPYVLEELDQEYQYAALPVVWHG